MCTEVLAPSSWVLDLNLMNKHITVIWTRTVE